MILYGMVCIAGHPQHWIEKTTRSNVQWVHVVSILTPTFFPTLLHHPCSSFYIVMLREQMNTERTHDSVIVRMNTLWWTNILQWNITIFNGKIHYFYGHFPLLFVCSPEGTGSSKTPGSWQHQKMCLPPCCRFAEHEPHFANHAVDGFKTVQPVVGCNESGSDSVSVSNSCSNQRQIGKLGMICYCNILQHQ